MTIASIGYDGTVQEGPWAKLAPYLGTRYSASGFAVTIGGTSDRAVTVGVGDAYGYGILDTNSATINLNAASVSSGSRWDTVVVSRNWSGTGGTTTVAIRTGTSSKAISASLTHTPGTLDDQPIALIRSTAGQTAVQELVDLRGFDSRPTFLNEAGYVPPAVGYGFGEAITGFNPPGSGQLDYQVRTGSTGSERWLSLTAPHADGGLAYGDLSYVGGPSGLTVFNGQSPWYTRAGGRFYIGGALQNRSGNLLANTVYPVATIASGDRPLKDATFPVAVSFGGVAQGGRLNISASTGALTFTPAEDTGWFTLDNVSWFPKGV